MAVISVGNGGIPFVEADGHAHCILLVCGCFALLRGEVTHRDHAARRRACVAHFGIHLYAGHIFVIDLQRSRRFFQLSSGECKRQRAEQNNAARDHKQRDEIIGQMCASSCLAMESAVAL